MIPEQQRFFFQQNVHFKHYIPQVPIGECLAGGKKIIQYQAHPELSNPLTTQHTRTLTSKHIHMSGLVDSVNGKMTAVGEVCEIHQLLCDVT